VGAGGGAEAAAAAAGAASGAHAPTGVPLAGPSGAGADVALIAVIISLMWLDWPAAGAAGELILALRWEEGRA